MLAADFLAVVSRKRIVGSQHGSRRKTRCRVGAEIRLQTPLLAQYAVSHYLDQAASWAPTWWNSNTPSAYPA